jgi:hypothetical protein
MKAQSIVVTAVCLVLVSLCVFAVFTTRVHAQEEGAAEEVSMFDLRGITRDIILVVVFSIVGLIILMVGYKVFDMATPYDLNKQIAEENNVAAGVAVAGVIISLGIIVMAAMG